MTRPVKFSNVESIVDQIIDEVGPTISVAIPLGIGKPNDIVNELTARAASGELDELEILTALSLNPPDAPEELAERLMGPVVERIYGDYTELDYVTMRAEGELPDNVTIREFYYPPGSLLSNEHAQRNHQSVNFTHVLREILEADVDLVAQLVSPAGDNYDLGGNTDLSLDVFEEFVRRREAGEASAMLVAQTNRRLPKLGADAQVAASTFDAVLDDPSYDFEPFALPKMPPIDAEYAIGLHASALVHDGGTIQIGIGSIGDAICWALRTRQHDNPTYAELIDDLELPQDTERLIDTVGGTDPLDQGLYAATEMLVEGLLELYEDGILHRRVVDDAALQRAIDDGDIGYQVGLDTLDFLVSEDVVETRLSRRDVAHLRQIGALRSDVAYLEGRGEIRIDGESVPADLSSDETRHLLAEKGLRDELDTHVVHAGFFVGSPDFYEMLRDFDGVDQQQVAMTTVSFTNLLTGQEELKRAQRRHGRYCNEAMKVTLLGAVASDSVESGRVVSGVGGQYEFVAMAHELDEARSIIMLPSTRGDGDDVESNIVWQYGHTTIPRHLRDIVITEYGIADLRGKSDEEVVGEMIEIADARFHDELVAAAKDADKLPDDYEVPTHARGNTPDTLHGRLAKHRDDGTIPRLPFGSSLTDIELDLAEALTNLSGLRDDLAEGRLPEIDVDDVWAAVTNEADARPYLERMGLDDPQNARETALQRFVVYGLASADII